MLKLLNNKAIIEGMSICIISLFVMCYIHCRLRSIYPLFKIFRKLATLRNSWR